MNAKPFAALMAACLALLAAPAFADAYGPASDSRSGNGAPASQDDQSAQSMRSGETQSSVMHKNHGGVGGSESPGSQSGKRAPDDTLDPMYHGG